MCVCSVTCAGQGRPRQSDMSRDPKKVKEWNVYFNFIYFLIKVWTINNEPYKWKYKYRNNLYIFMCRYICVSKTLSKNKYLNSEKKII